jgi:dTDP-4-amino-4,6-dideoxygalactose transaminase
MPTIPQTDPHANYLAHRTELDAAIQNVLDGGRYILGEQVAAFEHEFASYLGVREGVGVGSGTEALHLALLALGAGPGKVVYTVSHTAVATVAAIEMTGATAHLVDIDRATMTMDARRLEDEIAHTDPREGVPLGVVPVHLYGMPADIPAIMRIAERTGLVVLEDCAQAHGALIDGRTVGSWGAIAAYSFYPTKNLGALGDGGAVMVDDPALAARVRLLRQYGWQERYVSHISGINSRLDELQAGILRVKLRYLDSENARRAELAAIYDQELLGCSLLLPAPAPAGSRHVYHQYAVRTPNRDRLKDYLAERGIGTLVHYPVPVHLQPAYRERLPGCERLPESEEAARTVLSLPMYPELTEDAVHEVCGAILAAEREGVLAGPVR